MQAEIVPFQSFHAIALVIVVWLCRGVWAAWCSWNCFVPHLL